jgi:hypothetical protein
MTIKTATRRDPAKSSGDRSKLAAIAATMYSNVIRPGDWDRSKLAHGLDIILHRVDDHQWRLAMARDGVYPSDAEVAIVRSAFDVPEAADEARSEKQHRHTKTNRIINYRRVEITWQER